MSAPCARSQAHADFSSPAPASHPAKPAKDSSVDTGSVTNGIYRNKTLGFSCKIPPGWVLRTDEMNAPPESDENPDQQSASDRKTSDGSQQSGAQVKPTDKSGAVQNTGGRVLLAAFSRPPQAHGEEVNSSIVIAAEPVATYPGLTDAAQYFGPLTEVVRAQGFTVDEEPYEIAIGSKTLIRGDFHKDVGTRVMRQSTLAMLAHGYAVSFTVIAGTEDDVEDLVDGLAFSSPKAAAK